MRRREHHHRKLHPELGLALSSLAPELQGHGFQLQAVLWLKVDSGVN